MLVRWQNGGRQTIPQEITNAPVVEQAFDERLSLKMPVRFSPETDVPIQQLPKESRETVSRGDSTRSKGVSVQDARPKKSSVRQSERCDTVPLRLLRQALEPCV